MSSYTVSTEAGNDDPKAFADGTPLVRLFGKGARSRSLAVLVAERRRDLSISELSRQVGGTRKTVYDHIDELVDIGAAEIARETKTGPPLQARGHADRPETLRTRRCHTPPAGHI